MKYLTKEEFDALEFIRIETSHNYLYGLVKINDAIHATVSRYKTANPTIQQFPKALVSKVLKQKKSTFVDDHALIHINPSKYAWRWRATA